jgi:hypothetical protein
LSSRDLVLRLSAFAAAGLLVAACGKAPPPGGFSMPPAEVTTITVAPRDFPVSFEHVAQTLGSKDVEVRARVTGIVEKRLYQEGSFVKAGQPLFTIDPKLYQSQVNAAQAEVARAAAQKAQADREKARLIPLAERKAIGQKVPMIRVCIEGERAYEVKLDAGSASTIERVEGKARTPVSFSTNIYNVIRPYTIKVTVRETQIDASHNGSRLVLGEKDKEEFGRVGFKDVLDPLKIEVRGKVQTTWIDEQIEARLAPFPRGFRSRSQRLCSPANSPLRLPSLTGGCVPYRRGVHWKSHRSPMPLSAPVSRRRRVFTPRSGGPS